MNLPPLPSSRSKRSMRVRGSVTRPSVPLSTKLNSNVVLELVFMLSCPNEPPSATPFRAGFVGEYSVRLRMMRSKDTPSKRKELVVSSE